MALDLGSAPKTTDIEEAGRRVNIPDETGDTPYMDGDKPVTALIAGTYSKRFRKAQKRAAAREKALGEGITEDQAEEIRRDMWAECVIAWDLEIGGDPAVAQIFELRPHIYDFVVKTASGHAGFFAARVTSSSASP